MKNRKKGARNKQPRGAVIFERKKERWKDGRREPERKREI